MSTEPTTKEPTAKEPLTREPTTTEVERLAFHEVMPRVARLAEELTEHPDEEVRGTVDQLLYLVDVFHRDGLTNLLALVEAWRGEIFLEDVVKDDVLGELLGAYDLADLAGRNASDEAEGEAE